ncbi:MAG TPA: hypothetical protein PLV83_04455 [Bacilli bacterium]|nr:hypothetical protein [Bacilli bacterium]
MKKLVLRTSCYEGIKNSKSITIVHSQEHKKIVKEANQKIKEYRGKQIQALAKAEDYFVL